MGVTLKLLPFAPRAEFSQCVLPCEPPEELRDLLNALPLHDVPERFNTFLSRDGEIGKENTYYGLTTEDCYGDPLKFAKVREFKKLAENPEAAKLIDRWYQCREAWAYICAMRDDWNVALYWD